MYDHQALGGPMRDFADKLPDELEALAALGLRMRGCNPQQFRVHVADRANDVQYPSER